MIKTFLHTKAQLHSICFNIPQIPQSQEINNMLGKWSVGLCDCFGDSGTCCLTCWCPCITFGRIAEVVDGGSSCMCFLIFCAGDQRSSMRAQYNFPGSPYMDCLVHLCCERCALCQEYKELENRGFNMSKAGVVISVVRVHWKDVNEEKLKSLKVANTKKLKFKDFMEMFIEAATRIVDGIDLDTFVELASPTDA
ncbi:cell number regulator 11-like [Aegilops tauschii subsp. strangulata]|uniref:cell number regulator 11-like n=1 Tax=Aegilops tauschii subsp. strangulata TaxID=200361 RepID=UPI001ABC532B|nr:cell number regulator 11-like [Aegilops tauschii subsp. strangulata]